MIADKLAGGDTNIAVEYWDDYAEAEESEEHFADDNKDDNDNIDLDIAGDYDADEIFTQDAQISTPSIKVLLQEGEVMFKCETSTLLTRKTR